MSDEKIRIVIVDDIAETRENIRKLLQFESDMEVVDVATTGAQGVQVALDVQPDVMLMDINMPDMDGITATERIRARVPATQIVMLSVQSDSSYLRKAMIAGAHDFLTKPPDVGELTSAIRRAGEKAREERAKQASQQAVVEAVKAAGTSGRLNLPGAHDGKIITVYGPKGGTGSTTITANLAVALHTEDTPVCVVDGRLQYGDLSFFFNEQGRNNVIDLAQRVNELEPEFVKEVLINHEASGVSILAGPPRPEQAEAVNGADFVQILEFLKNMFAYVLVDTGSNLDDVTINVIEISDVILLVTTQDIPSIKNIRLFLDLADALGLSRSSMVIAMNRFDKRRNVTPDRVGEITKTPVVGVLPLEESMVIPAMDRGVPFMVDNQRHVVARSVKQMASNLLKRIEEMDRTSAEAF